ncbi:MAG: type II toxin-antitoxin system RelE/ParE family toxin [Lentisphaeria bacterium]|nr:type II toxin-antitoxin system RelE/ParE family toxin [Lentisphaeria bacterium]
MVESAQSLQDLRCYPPLHLEIIKGKLKNRKAPTGEWSIRVIGTKYRVIFIPCDDDGNEKIGGDILAEAQVIKIIKITEVSKHYD